MWEPAETDGVRREGPGDGKEHHAYAFHTPCETQMTVGDAGSWRATIACGRAEGCAARQTLWRYRVPTAGRQNVSARTSQAEKRREDSVQESKRNSVRNEARQGKKTRNTHHASRITRHTKRNTQTRTRHDAQHTTRNT